MGYRIIYGKQKRRLSPGAKRLMAAVFAGAILIGIGYYCRPRLPERALENMVDAVRSGAPLSDAVTAFCREIIENAEAVY